MHRTSLVSIIVHELTQQYTNATALNSSATAGYGKPNLSFDFTFVINNDFNRHCSTYFNTHSLLVHILVMLIIYATVTNL